jgi:hypothetical protein
MGVFTRQGCACEPVQQDYGEDVLVQTRVDERMEGTRLWIQVKATDGWAS